MSDSNNGTPNAPATPEVAAQDGGNEPDLMSMSGEQAKAYFEAQKAAKANPQTKTPSASSEAAKEAMRRFKVKVDGQELEVDEQELVRGYAHQKAASKMLTEGQKARKQAEEFVRMMKDPEKFYEVAKKLGHNPHDLSVKYLAEHIKEEEMDPRDKELRDTKRKLQAIEDMERQQREAIEKQRNDALKAKFAKDYSDQFVEALQSSGLPPTKPMVAEMAKYISRAASMGFQMTAAEASQLVKEDVMLAHQRLIGDSDAETLIKLLGEENINKVRKYDTSRVKTPEQYLRTPEVQAPRNERSKSTNQRMTSKEWRDYNRKK